jgi:diacylglycerol kinase (ATP)
MSHISHKEFSILRRATSMRHAVRGVGVYMRITPNFWVHALTFLVVALLGFIFCISTMEWALLVLANGVVFAAEAFNSALEIDMNLTHPGEHPMVRDTKDIAAGAVLIAGIFAWVIDLIILLPYLFR